MAKIPFYWMLMLLLISGCEGGRNAVSVSAGATPSIRLLEEGQTDYGLRPFVQILADTSPGYAFRDIIEPDLQRQFQPYPEYTNPLENYKYYWGKLQVKNQLKYAGQHTEWVLSFSSRWTDLDVFIVEADGSWRRERNGTFTPDSEKSFVPTAQGNLVKVMLPPNEVVTIYFKGISERTAIYPSFYTRLRHIEVFYSDLLKTKVANAFFIGFLLMMFFYNLIVYFFGKDRSFIFYSGYLLMVVVYAAYPSDDLVDWFGLFANQPAYQHFTKLSLYLSMMCYLAFIRSFLDLEQLLPKWDALLKTVIYLGCPLIAIDIIVLWRTNFSYVVEDWIAVPYIVLVVLVCCALLYPLLKTGDKKGYFIIGGITAICLGAALTVISRIYMPPFSIFYLKAGTIVEVIIFSLGLAYRQRQLKQAQQQASFKVKESLLIQEKKALEASQLKELNAFKARFYTNITHEFRTPLTVIMGVAENINNHEQEKQLIRRNSENLLGLVNQLLDLSKLESGTLALHKVQRDIIVYLQYLTESFYSSAAQKHIRLVFYSEEEALTMDYDEGKVQQIIYNLLWNALKFTEAYGKIVLHASSTEEEGKPFLKLKVKDTGRGILPEHIGQIFNRFYQADSHAATGAGIGLALTKELVELMDGRIEVQSQVGKGTVFTLYLPIETKAEPPTEKAILETERLPSPGAIAVAPQVHPPDETGSTATTDLPKLLVIEDNPDIIAYITSILVDKYEIYKALNGALGIETALEVIPDIIISDVMMPEKNGHEVCEALKQDERTSHVPIILLTAKAAQTDKIEGLKYGADAYLTKPFDKEELLVRLEKLVQTRRQMQRHYAGIEPMPQAATTAVDDMFLQKLQGHIQDHLGDTEFGVAQLAATANMSSMQIYRKLKALTGKTPSQFIRSYRLQCALALLKEGSANVSEIAYEVGFSDPSYFSRVFQKEFGKRPSDFLK